MLFYKHKKSFIPFAYVRAYVQPHDVTPLRTYATSSTYVKTDDVFWRGNFRYMGGGGGGGGGGNTTPVYLGFFAGSEQKIALSPVHGPSFGTGDQEPKNFF
jgi:hypothetical protein